MTWASESDLWRTLDDWNRRPENYNYTRQMYLLEYLERSIFEQYVPTGGPSPKFSSRLRSWLGNIDDEEGQRVLFKLVLYLLFINREQMITLMRAAFNGPIMRRLIELFGEAVVHNVESTDLDDWLAKTWFCGITDSMDISNFYHINHIEARWHRPQWQDLQRYGSEDKITKALAGSKIELVVLLEDFVGSGDQMAKPIEFASSLIGDVQLLVVPLICCPSGVKKGRDLAKTFPNLIFEPVLALDLQHFVTPEEQPDEKALFKDVRRIAVETYDQVKGSLSTPARARNDKPYGPFGYKETGGLTVLYTNTPDNTLPLIHHRSSTWNALFPRSARW